MRNIFISAFLIAVLGVFATTVELHAQAEGYSTYYHQRQSLFEILPVTKGGIVFLGNSITDGCEWSEFFPGQMVFNRGISGDVTSGVLDRLETVIRMEPEKVFLMIGVNDLAGNVETDTVFSNICKVATRIREHAPQCQVYLMSLLPVNPNFGRFTGHASKSLPILDINKRLQLWSLDKEGIVFVDLYLRFLDVDGYLHKNFTNDGLHLNGQGYYLWASLIKDLVENE